MPRGHGAQNWLDGCGLVARCEWRALTARAEDKIYFDDVTHEPKPGQEDTRMPPDDVWQQRFVAVAPGPAGCSVVLAWRGHIVRSSKEGYDAGRWPPELLETLLERSTLTPKPGAAPLRQ